MSYIPEIVVAFFPRSVTFLFLTLFFFKKNLILFVITVLYLVERNWIWFEIPFSWNLNVFAVWFGVYHVKFNSKSEVVLNSSFGKLVSIYLLFFCMVDVKYCRICWN